MSAKKPAKPAKDAPLTPKQELFVREYLLDLNGRQAAIRAGYSEKTADQQASRLISNVKVQEAIAAGRLRTEQALELTRDDCIRQYQRLAFSDPRKMFDAYGQIKPINDLDDDTAAAVQGMDLDYQRGEDGEFTPVLKIKMADRKSALDSIMKAQGWNSAEKHEVTGKNGGAIEHSVRVVLVPPKHKAEVLTRRIDQTAEEG